MSRARKPEGPPVARRPEECVCRLGVTHPGDGTFGRVCMVFGLVEQIDASHHVEPAQWRAPDTNWYEFSCSWWLVRFIV